MSLDVDDPEKGLEGDKIIWIEGRNKHTLEIIRIEEVGYRYAVSLSHSVTRKIFGFPIKTTHEVRSILGGPGNWTCLDTGEIYQPAFLDSLLDNKLRLIEAIEHMRDFG